MVRDATATRARILDAAVEEFAAVGLAGGRVDRIAASAGVDKKLIYNYFTDKESLFGAALHRTLEQMVRAVPIDESDLPGYAGRLFDHVLAHPEAHRLSMWRQLERPQAGPDDRELYEEKVSAMTAGTVGGPSAIAPVDLLVLVQGMAGAWLLTPNHLLAADGSDPSGAGRIGLHRAALVSAVRRIVGDDDADRDVTA